MTYFCSIGSQILYIFETHGIGQTPSSLKRYVVLTAFRPVQVQYRSTIFLSKHAAKQGMHIQELWRSKHTKCHILEHWLELDN